MEELELQIRKVLQKIVKQYHEFITMPDHASQMHKILLELKEINKEPLETVQSMAELMEQLVDVGSDVLKVSLQSKYVDKSSKREKEVGYKTEGWHLDWVDLESRIKQNDIEEDYLKLEEMLQNHEKQVRQHIRVEQQLRFYIEGIQEKMDQQKKSYKDKLNLLEKDNQRLKGDIQKIKNIRLVNNVSNNNSNNKCNNNASNYNNSSIKLVTTNGNSIKVVNANGNAMLDRRFQIKNGFNRSSFIKKQKNSYDSLIGRSKDSIKIDKMQSIYGQGKRQNLMERVAQQSRNNTHSNNQKQNSYIRSLNKIYKL